MAHNITKIKEWTDVTKDIFHNEILPLNQPAVLKGVNQSWPAVTKSRESNQAIIEYLCKYDQGLEVPALIAPPEIKGHFDYQPDFKRFNFERSNQPLVKMLQDLYALSEHPNPPGFSIQGLDLDEHLSGFSNKNHQSLLDAHETARIWIGNKTTTRTHYDHVDNLACVVTGNRKFTLFPPDQVANLYVGPLLSTPAGPPVSMVNLAAPDFNKYPNFNLALEVAQESILEPGDAIYIPYLWWHNVESLDSFNVLVNYWWSKDPANEVAPYQCLMHSMLSFPELPEYQRKIWRTVFDHYVFQLEGKPGAHLPDDLQDIVTHLSDEQRQKLRSLLGQGLLS